MNNREEYYYDLPQDLIAQTPLTQRDKARLMVINRKTKKISHDTFDNVSKYLPPKSVLVLNNSKVVPARLLGQKEKTGAKIEIFLLKRLEDGYSYKVLLRPLKRLKNGDHIIFGSSSVKATVMDWEKRIVRFNQKNILKYLKEIGHIPLPPYIKRQDTPEDHEFYQTVYARYAGSVAAPTAGLHFTKDLLDALKRQGHFLKQILLHINYATFKSVEEEDITQHKMHYEDFSMSSHVFNFLTKARSQGQKVVAVGTTSCRVLETVSRTKILKGETDLFIYPGYQFEMVDVLITNFHLPYSSLLMLVFAFGSSSLMKKAYTVAIKKKYRFYSYGDAMIIL